MRREELHPGTPIEAKDLSEITSQWAAPARSIGFPGAISLYCFEPVALEASWHA